MNTNKGRDFVSLGRILGALCILLMPAGIPLTSELINLSTTGWVGTGTQKMNAGIVVEGTETRTFGIYVFGPTLEDSGVSGVLQDPKLRLRNVLDGSVIVENDNWQDGDSADEVQDLIDAGLISLDDREPAVIVELGPGSYSAEVEGADQGTGMAQVNVTDLTAIVAVNSGVWLGEGICFNVAPDGKSLTANGSLCLGGVALVAIINENFCNINVSVTEDIPINANRFSVTVPSTSGGQEVSGVFSSETTASGTATVIDNFNSCSADWSAEFIQP